LPFLGTLLSVPGAAGNSRHRWIVASLAKATFSTLVTLPLQTFSSLFGVPRATGFTCDRRLAAIVAETGHPPISTPLILSCVTLSPSLDVHRHDIMEVTGGVAMLTCYSPDRTKQKQIDNALEHLERSKKNYLRPGEQLLSTHDRLRDAFGAMISIESVSSQRSHEIVGTLHQEIFRGLGLMIVKEDGGQILARFGFEANIRRCEECDRRDDDNLAVRNQRVHYHNAGLLAPPMAQHFDALESSTLEAIFEHRRQAHNSTDTFL
jgi:hypothetical protein